MIVWVSVVLIRTVSTTCAVVTLVIDLVLVVQTLDSAIHQINFYPADNTIVSRNAYPVDTAVQRLNKRGLIGHLSRRDVIGYEDS